MAVNLSPIGNGFQFFNNDGLPLNAGKIITYQAGSTTPFTTYTDSSGLIANTNPIILGTDGRPPSTIWLSEGFFYKFVLTTAADVVIQTYDNLYGIIGAAPPAATPIPAGGIFLWSGSIGSIPAGYVLCNGSNGTPDLRDRFVVGAGSSYAVNATGGTADSIVVSHSHTLASGTLSTAGSHSHPTFVSTGATSSSDSTGGIMLNAENSTTYIANTGVAGADAGSQLGIAGDHTHTLGGSTGSAGISGTNANLPPYYALCYIMKT
jgi:hypothetical protein